MTPRQREKLKARLLELRHEARPHKVEAGPKDEDGAPLTEMLQAISSTRNREQAALVSRIDRALHKLRDSPDDFGLCEECEEEIPLKRLEVMPHATHCAACQSKADPQRGLARKKLTDYK